MATKKIKTLSDMTIHEGPVYVTGNTIKELKSFISELPDDITISLETSPHNAAPLAFDRVVTGTNPRGKSEQIALFHQVTKESLGAIRAQAAAGELPKLDSARRTAMSGRDRIAPGVINQLKTQVRSSITGLALMGIPLTTVVALLESEPKPWPGEHHYRHTALIEQASYAAYSSLEAPAIAGVDYEESLALVNDAWGEGNAKAAAAGR